MKKIVLSLLVLLLCFTMLPSCSFEPILDAEAPESKGDFNFIYGDLGGENNSIIIFQTVSKDAFGTLSPEDDFVFVKPESVPVAENLKFQKIRAEYAYSVSGIEAYQNDSFAVPSEYEGMPVTKIGYRAFFGMKKVKYVELSEGIRNIGSYAFSEATDLICVMIPGTVEAIGMGAFAKCENLTEIYYGGTKESWTSIFKDYYWSDGSPVKVIHCQDGDLFP